MKTVTSFLQPIKVRKVNLMRSRGIVIVITIVAILFGAATVLSGGRALFGGPEVNARLGQTVPFVLWFNFFAAFLYLLAEEGLLLRRRWAVPLSLLVAVATVFSFCSLWPLRPERRRLRDADRRRAHPPGPVLDRRDHRRPAGHEEPQEREVMAMRGVMAGISRPVIDNRGAVMKREPCKHAPSVWLPAACLALGMGILAGCAVGPDFRRPEPPQVSGYSATALPGQTAAAPGSLGEAQRFVPGSPVPADWWREWGSAKLNALVQQALNASPTLDAAKATLLQARETYEAQSGATLFPQATGQAGAQRRQTNNASSGQAGGERTYELYNAGVGVSYNLDIFGGNRRALEALAAQADYQLYQLAGARLALAANVVTTAILQAQLVDQIRASEALLATQEEQLDLTSRRLALGAASQSDVLALQVQVEQSRAALSPLRTRLDQTQHLLSVLIGRPPGSVDVIMFTLADFRLPTELPLRIPSELARQRPDIQASEALLHAANAQYGAVLAKQYPRLTLSADLGWQSLTLGSLFGSGALVWGLAGQVAQPLFNAGLPAEARAAEAAFAAAEANYRQTVLQALRNVADVLRALDHDAKALAAQAAADQAARESMLLTRQGYALGTVSYLQLLIAQQQAQQTALGLIAARSQRLADTVALYQSMGGGWSPDDVRRPDWRSQRKKPMGKPGPSEKAHRKPTAPPFSMATSLR